MPNAAADSRFGKVAALWRFPVKSMGGEELDQVSVSANGLLGDRALALIDVETESVVSAKSVRLFPDVLQCRAAFVEPPDAGKALPPVRIALPSGESVRSDSPHVDQVLTAHFRRQVRLARADDPAASAATQAGAFFDLYPLSVVTTATLARLNELSPQSRFDARRFRMNVVVGSPESGFVENEWIGREIAVGAAVRLRLERPDLRCVMTTLPQGDLPNDPEILRAIVRHNPMHVGSQGPFPCVGAYAVVEAAGLLKKGDRVVI